MHWTWLVTVAAIVGVVANIHKRTWCFAIWLVTNACWAVYDWRIGARAQSVLFMIYTVLAAWGLVKWRRGTGEEE